MTRTALDKEAVYKAYKHGATVNSILKDYGINKERLWRVLREVGGAEFKITKR